MGRAFQKGIDYKNRYYDYKFPAYDYGTRVHDYSNRREKLHLPAVIHRPGSTFDQRDELDESRDPGRGTEL